MSVPRRHDSHAISGPSLILRTLHQFHFLVSDHRLHSCSFNDLCVIPALNAVNTTLPTLGAPTPFLCPFPFLLPALEVHLAFIEGSCEQSAGLGARKLGPSPRFDSN